MTLPLRPGDLACGFDVDTGRMRCGTVVEVSEPIAEREQCRAVIEERNGRRATIGWPYVGPWTRSRGV